MDNFLGLGIIFKFILTRNGMPTKRTNWTRANKQRFCNTNNNMDKQVILDTLINFNSGHCTIHLDTMNLEGIDYNIAQELNKMIDNRNNFVSEFSRIEKHVGVHG